MDPDRPQPAGDPTHGNTLYGGPLVGPRHDPATEESTYDTTGPVPHGGPKYPHQWDHIPPPQVPLSYKVFAVLVAVFVLALIAYGIWHG